MSVNRNYYAIAGYDLTRWVTEKYEEWQWSEEGEEYTCCHTANRIQIFDDPMGGYHFYLGFVLGGGDEYDFETIKFDMEVINQVHGSVESELDKLIDLGVIRVDAKLHTKYQVIVFEECT